MKYAVGVSLALGIAIGAGAMYGLNAQGSLPAYSVNEVEITDAAAYAPIQDILRAENAKAGGKFLTRSGTTVAVEGAAPPRVTISQWKSVDDAKKFYATPAVKKAFEDRKKFTKNTRTFIVEGLPN
jgi:uncharacterized protein (DUF1330 family)